MFERIIVAIFIAWCLAQVVFLGLTSNSLASEAQGISRLLKVGPKERLSSPSKAAALAKDGDTVEIAAGTYVRDAAVWTQNNLTLRGTGGRARLIADGAHAEGKAIWVIRGNNTTVENVDFLGASVSDGNGAGIRQEGAGLVLRNCYFSGNQNGILAGANSDSDILIESAEFIENGKGDGHTHNIYIGKVRSFKLRYSYVHRAKVGHNVKSRALSNYVLYNRIMDEVTGTASYEIDLPNGGRGYIIGNLIQKGPAAENSAIISYAAEGMTNPTNQLYIVNNTIVNDRPQGGQFVVFKAQPQYVKIINNIFSGRGTLLQAGRADLSKNLTTDRPGLKDVRNFDYRLSSRSAAIDAGIDPGSGDGYSLRPIKQYRPDIGQIKRPVIGPIDIGAYEYDGKE